MLESKESLFYAGITATLIILMINEVITFAQNGGLSNPLGLSLVKLMFYSLFLSLVFTNSLKTMTSKSLNLMIQISKKMSITHEYSKKNDFYDEECENEKYSQ